MINVLGFLLVILSPFCMGLPWVRVGRARRDITRICFAYVTGYFMRLTLFHIIALPATIAGMRFSTMSNVFTGALLATCVVSAWLGKDAFRSRRKKRKPATFEMIYCVVFIGLLLVQLYLTIVMDPTYMTYDDAGYTAYSSDALATDYMFITYPQTGEFMQFDYRIIQTALLFPAYIVRMTGMPVTMVERTFSYALNLLLAYGCYVYMAEDLYKRREDRFVFLIVLSVIYIFGYHSHYSMTFRLLGPNSQGKAILAVTLVPLLLVLLRKWLDQEFNWRFGLLLSLLSNAACALSLMGAVYVIGVVFLTIVLFLFRKQRRWKHLLYGIFAGTIPCVYIGTFLLMKYNIV